MTSNNNNISDDAIKTNNTSHKEGGSTGNGDTGVVLEPFVIDLFEDIARNQGFTDYVIEPSSGSNHGDGFMGVMLRVLVKGVRNNRPDVLSLMLKMPPLGKVRRETFNSAAVFERESYMYEKVLPMFVEFQKEKGLLPGGSDGFYAFPKCYAIVCDRETDRFAIILEDLKDQGYEMFNKFNVIDIEHVRFVMEELAKLHAISFALRDQRPEVFSPLQQLEDVFLKHMITANPELMQGFQDQAFGRAMETLDAEETELKSKIDKLRIEFNKHLGDCVRLNVAEPFSVINHGDCWNNNMMFLYNGSTTPKKVCLYDYQIARMASPALDVVYFLLSSTVKSLRDTELDSIIRMYYDYLSESIRKLGSDPEKLFTFSDLQKQLRKFGKYGVLTAPTLVQIITADPTDIPDMDDFAENLNDNGHTNINLFISKKTENSYNVRMRDVLRDADALGYLSNIL